MQPPTAPQKLPVNIEDEMRRSYLDYSMSVIVGRALPDVRDGLKPVHRRVLYAMDNLGNTSSRAYKKSARVVGDVIGKYHPHGDVAVYDSIVRLAQDFSMRYPLVDGQGNFGSVDGDPPAAMRYTEIRMSRLAEALLADLDKETVDFGPNYDGNEIEPLVLPAGFPNLLVNGATGIAVGMATNIPPHNMREVIDATIHLIENPRCSVADLMGFVPGPDFPTAGFIYGTDEIRKAYETGRGQIQVRGRATVEVHKKTERESIVITEIPFQLNKTRLIERIAELVGDKKLEGISDLRDESDRDGMRIVVELKRDAISAVVLNNLFALTPLQETFGIILLAIDNGQPRVLTLKEMLERFVAHRREVVTRRTRFELRKAKEREHILLGLQIALDHLDEVIALIRKSKDREVASTGLQQTFGLTEIQAKAILEIQLHRLTSLERQKIIDELKEVQADITRLQEILSVEKVLLALIVSELTALRDAHSDDRRTEIVSEQTDLSAEDLIADEDMVVTLSHAGYVKRSPLSEYRAQRRGGRGKIGAGSREDDFVENLFVARAHAYVLVFSTRGRLYWLKVHEIPAAGRAAKGKPIINLVKFRPEEQLAAILPVRKFEEGKFVVMVTRQGIIKKTSLDEYSNPRPSGIIALSIEEGDGLVGVRLTDGKRDILLSTAQGMAIRFSEEDVRPMGRTAYGVKAITLEQGDSVVEADVLEQGTSVLTVTENGYGKRTEESEYRVQGRGGKGLITMKTTDRNGLVVGALQVRDDDSIMVITNRGMLIRMLTKDISVIGRNTQGVRLITLESEGEQVVGITRVAKDEAVPENGGPASEPGGEPDGGPEGGGEPQSEPDTEPEPPTGVPPANGLQ
jgi:DNA gyrase subunit A